MGSEKIEKIVTSDYRPGERPGRKSAGLRSNRALIGSLVVHFCLLAGLLLRAFVFNSPPLANQPFQLTAEFNEEDNQEPTPVEFSHEEPPVPDEHVESPLPTVSDEPIEPAPWLRPHKAEDQPLLPGPNDRAEPRPKDLSQKYRLPVKQVQNKPQPQKASTPPKAKAATPAPSVARLRTARKKSGECPKPRYPRRALQRGLEGRVTFLVDVSETGEVLGLQLEKSSGHDMLDRAARRAIEKWRFAPATRAGKPVRDRVRVPMTFRLPR